MVIHIESLSICGHLFADDCQALPKIDHDQINDGNALVNFDLAKLKDSISRCGIEYNRSNFNRIKVSSVSLESEQLVWYLKSFQICE